METTSLSLLERLSTRTDIGAWERFERLYRPWLAGWLRRCALQPADADDVVQEVLAVLVREVPTFQHNGQTGAFRKWLRGIVVNRLREYYRRQPKEHDATNLTPGASHWFEQLADERSTMTETWNREHDLYVMHKLLHQIAGDFEPQTWRTFQAFVMEGQSAAAVAAQLGISEASVWAAKSRIMKRLRAEAHDLLE